MAVGSILVVSLLPNKAEMLVLPGVRGGRLRGQPLTVLSYMVKKPSSLCQLPFTERECVCVCVCMHVCVSRVPLPWSCAFLDSKERFSQNCCDLFIFWQTIVWCIEMLGSIPA